MERLLLGYLELVDEKDREEFYMDSRRDVRTKEGDLSEKENVAEWAIFLNSPWSVDSEYYRIIRNHRADSETVDSSIPEWVCKNIVIAYDCITAVVYGYGKSKREALEDCERNFNWVQMMFNPEKDSI